MNISLEKLQHSFFKKPLVVGGVAMEYYGMRKAGKDIDLVVSREDFVLLLKKYPERVKDLWGDIGVCPFDFEIWNTINYDAYEYLCNGATDEGNVFVISLEKLLYMKALAMEKEKYARDTVLVVKEILKRKSPTYEVLKKANDQLFQNIENITFIEKTGPAE